MEDVSAVVETIADEDAEWLLDADDHEVSDRDALSGLSKESREILERIGLGGRVKKADDDDILEEKVKVRVSALISSSLVVTSSHVRSTIHRELTRNYHNSSQSCVAQRFRRRCHHLLQRRQMSPRRSP